MKKIIYTLAMTLLPLTLFGQSYSSLWKKVADAQAKDLPKTQADLLRQIAAKAEKEAQYGHLLKAQLMQASVNTQVSPDSADLEIGRLEQRAQAAKDPVAKAVYASVLGKIYQLRPGEEGKSKSWFARSMEQPELLARHTGSEYEPALLNGIDSKIFYDDLLHVIGFEAADYTTLREYYTRNGNRAAACIAACYEIMAKRQNDKLECRKSKYLHTVDSLIREYADLREAGELAIEHYNFMSQSNDATVEERINYINYALSRWGAWPRMNILRNAQSDLQLPSFNINIGDFMFLPDAERMVRINSIRNISELNVNIYRVNVDGNTTLDPNDKDDYAKLQKLLVPGAVQSITRRYIGQPAWKENYDSITLAKMPVGMYLIEATTDNKDVPPQRMLLHVSNLFVMHEALPDKTLRFVVVNATTGKPVSGAHLVLTTAPVYDNAKATIDRLTTNKHGEAYYQWKRSRPEVYVYTDDDRACGVFPLDSYYSHWEKPNENKRLSLFTDRGIYRPGQQVQVAAIAWHIDQRALKSNALANEQITLRLADANGREVATQKVMTDRFGKASATFTLPQSGLTGQFHLTANGAQTGTATSFSVEQYKRPTFQVEFEPYGKEYHAGDTVMLKGTAKTYSGVPVQGAKVAYSVSRRSSLWWRWTGNDDTDNLLTDSLTTADDGTFMVRVPMHYPDNQLLDRPVLYNMVVSAKVTDLAGESHEAETALPLSNRSSFLTADLPTKVLRDSLKTLTFSRRNVAGQEIEGIVRYRIDGGPWKIAAANKAVSLEQRLSSGKHLLEGICETDTVKQQFVVFSLTDKKPAVETHDWFYVSAGQFPADGKPVYLQMGTSDDDVHVYYSVTSGNKILDKGSRVLSNEVQTEKLTYTPAMGDGITINLAWVRRGRLYEHTVQLQRPLPDQRLKLSWKTFRDKLTPGQKEEWTLQIVAPDGKPAQAQLLAAMYDKSLDAVRPFNWHFDNSYSLSTTWARWDGGSNQTVGLYGFQPIKALPERELSFNHWDEQMFEFANPYVFYTRSKPVMLTGFSRSVKIRGTKAMAEPLSAMAATDQVMRSKTGGAAQEASIDMDAGSGALAENAVVSNTTPEQGKGEVQLRENFNETAFFYPALTADAQGNVAIRFTLPESVTTWRFMGLAHDEQMNYGQIAAEAVAKKTVMVQPNLPRFIRMGDKALLATRIANTSERKASGTLRLQLLTPETETLVCEWTKPFALEAGQSESYSFDVDADQVAGQGKGNTLFIVRATASGKGFSDGEQHFLPLLPNREYVTTTVPFTQNGAGTKTIDISRLFPVDDRNNRLTVEYTQNPAWLVVQALPTVATPDDHNAISLATAIYANAIAQRLLTSSPKIAETIRLWQQETGKETSLMSSLQKNKDLKTLVLSETPWVAAAESESAQKQQLAAFLDKNTADYRLSTFTARLNELQNPDGSFSWWPGMRGNTYMTMAVVKTLTRLNAMIGTQVATHDMLNKAFAYLDRRMAEEVAELKKMEKKGGKRLQPSETACNYLYANALAKRPETENTRYLVALLDKMPTDLTIYGKAGAAIILAQYGKMKHAADYLQSLEEYTVYKQEMGRYYDTRKARYSWFDYKIPTQVAAIEAIKALKPSDTQVVEDMQQWLLQEKRTTGWSTPLNAVDAVYAFLARQDGTADMSKLATDDTADLRIDGKAIDLPKATAGLGYVKTTLQPAGGKTFAAVKADSGTSWGALYAQYWQKATDVETTASGLQVKRELLSADGKTAPNHLKVGDKVIVRITLTADRDYDFVQVQDKRAACLEPTEQLSGYRGGYYCAPHDNETKYYFDRIAKGKHIVETTYYVDREGNYTSGICTVQCAYSPEYSGREAAKSLQVTR